jgi:hypothetical protein
MDTDEEWAVRIRNLKFEAFNQDWLDVVSAPPDQVGSCILQSFVQFLGLHFCVTGIHDTDRA